MMHMLNCNRFTAVVNYIHTATQTHSPTFSSIPYFPLFNIRMPFHNEAYLRGENYTIRL